MKTSEIYELIEKIETSKISEFEYSNGDFSVSIKKEPKNTIVQTMPISNDSTETKSITVDVDTSAKKVESNNDKATKAPLVGTFYRASAPGEKPFVMIGQKIKKGDVIGIIEAMKMMNDIVATEDGVVTSIDVEDGKMVEFDQPLLQYQQ